MRAIHRAIPWFTLALPLERSTDGRRAWVRGAPHAAQLTGSLAHPLATTPRQVTLSPMDLALNTLMVIAQALLAWASFTWALKARESAADAWRYADAAAEHTRWIQAQQQDFAITAKARYREAQDLYRKATAILDQAGRLADPQNETQHGTPLQDPNP